MLLNTGTLTDSFYVDGQYIGSVPMPASAISDNSFWFDLAMVGAVDQPGYDHTQYTSYFDNVNLAAVPEPGAYTIFISLGLGSAATCLRRKRSR
jgi:hypothetical protein